MIKFRRRLLNILLSIVLVITGLPISVVSAAVPSASDIVVPTKLTKADDSDYNPNFVFEDSIFSDKYNEILDAVSDIPEIGKLPTLAEFEQMGYVRSQFMTLTKFRQTYGVGSSFVVPGSNVTIYIDNEAELDLLAKLVNNVADGETSTEQVYYAAGNYKLFKDIKYSGTTYQPIGTYDYPFNGTFDGDGYEIINLKLIDNVESQAMYSGFDYLGVFGYTGTGSVIKKLGIVGMTLTASYVIGGDAAFLCARNNGLIEDCYVNGKRTSVLTISNSTAGGICGENYGTIRGCYADATVNAAMYSGTYSEPQPIATVNHTEDGGIVENCYYINEQLFELYNLSSRTNTDINYLKSSANIVTGNESYAVGWHYTRDKSLINGTGLNFYEFMEHLSEKPGMHIGNGAVILNQQKKQYGQYLYGGIYYIEDLREIVNSCNHFVGNKIGFDMYGSMQYTNATSSYQSGISIYIRDHNDWNTYCRLVNKTMPNETDEEALFWSKLGVTVLNDNFVQYGSKSLMTLDLYQDDEQLGTEDHPFRGVFNTWRSVVIRLNLENRNSGVVAPIFGYNKGSIYIGNIFITGDDISGYINKSILCGVNENVIDFGYNSNFSYQDKFVINNTYEVTRDKSGVNIYSNNPNYALLADKDYTGITLVGQVKASSYTRIHSGFAYQWYSADNTDVPIGYNYIPTCTNVEDDANYIFYNTVCNGQALYPNETMAGSWAGGYTYYYTYSLLSNTNNRYINNSFSISEDYFYLPIIQAYPSFSTPTMVNGEYQVFNDKHLIWLIKNGHGENARLMNTIDMSRYEFTGSPYSGYFNLDGTLTDATDICNQIDLGVTKCYGIVGLTITDTKLSDRNTGVSGGAHINSINWNNVYFIGGTFTPGNQFVNTYTDSYSCWLGNELNNVHSSIDVKVRIRNYTDYYSSPKYIAPAAVANYSTNSGTMEFNEDNYYNRGTTYCGIAYNTNYCISYVNLRLLQDAGYINCTGYNVNKCRYRGTTEKPASLSYNAFDVWYYGDVSGLGHVVSNSICDWVYNFNTDTSFPIYLISGASDYGVQSATNVVVSGTLRIPKTYSLSTVVLTRVCNGLVVTDTALFDGNVGLSNANSNCSWEIFRGTINLYITTGSFYFNSGGYTVNTYSDGVINLYKNPDNTSSYYTNQAVLNCSNTYDKNITICCGFTVVNGVGICNSTVNFVDLDDIYFSDLTLTMGSGSYSSNSVYYNYTDIDLVNTKVIIDEIKLIYGALKLYNYGNVTVKNGNVVDDVIFIFGDQAYDRNCVVKNFGDLRIDGSVNGEVGLIKVEHYTDGVTIINYGNITVNKARTDVGFNYIYAISGFGWNYGDINIDYNNTGNSVRCNRTTVAGSDLLGKNCGDINISNVYNSIASSDFLMFTIRGGGTENYGDINIQDCTLSNLELYNLYMEKLDYYTFDVCADNNIIKNTVNVDNIAVKNFTYEGFNKFQFGNADVDTSNMYICADISITNVDCEIFNFLSGVDFTNGNNYPVWGNGYNIYCINSIEFDNVNVSETFGMLGVLLRGSKFDKGMKLNNNTTNIHDCDFRCMYYAGIGQFCIGGNTAPLINNETFNINDVAIHARSYVNGIVGNYNYPTSGGYYAETLLESAYVNNAYTFGTMNINVTGAPVVVSGIGRCTKINNESDALRNIVINAADITVSNDDEICICGISYDTGASDSYIHNAINCGNLTANQLSSNKYTYVYGITNTADKVMSVANYGILTTNSEYSKTFAICETVRSVGVGCVNYGDIVVPVLNEGYSSVIGTNSGKIGFTINYGNIANALSKNSGTFSGIVDLSDNKNAIPNGEYTYSTDSTMTGVTGKQAKGYNDFDNVIAYIDEVVDDSNMNRHIDYDDILDPDFMFRYCNSINTKYLTSTTRQWYNGENLFDYSDVGNLRGRLLSEVNARSGVGGYVLCASDKDGKNLMTCELERMLYKNNVVNNANAYDWWSDYSVHGVRFDTYINTVLRQRQYESIAEVYDVAITSVDEFETKSGDNVLIQNTSSLVPFQAPIGSPLSENNLVTIVDLYVLINNYVDAAGHDIEWNFNVTGSSNMSFNIYDEPYVYATDAAFKTGLQSMSDNLVLTGVNNSNKITLRLQELGGTTLAIIGYEKSESNDKYNIIAVRLHSCSTEPMGWLRSFSYPTSINSVNSWFDMTDAFTGNQAFYDNAKGYDSYTGDGYTLDVGTEESGRTYPIYNMTIPYIHSSNGEYLYRTGSNRIDATRAFTFNLGLQNIKSISLSITGDGITEAFTGSGNAPSTGIASKDGTVVIKTITDEIGLGNGSTITMNRDITIYYNDNNPFYRGGDKKIEFYGVSADTNETVKLFEINLTKSLSFENYIKYAFWGRTWYGVENDFTHYDTESSISIETVLFGDMQYYTNYRSTLSTAENYKTTLGPFTRHGSYTYYPDYVNNSCDIIAENGNSKEYTMRTTFLVFNTVDITGYSYIYDGYFRNGVFIVNEDSEEFSFEAEYNTGKVSEFVCNGYSDFGDNPISMYVEKFDVYVDGVYQRTVNCTENNDPYDSTFGLTVYTTRHGSWSVGNHIKISKDGSVPKADLPDEAITIKPYVKYDFADGRYMQFECDPVTFVKHLSPDRQLIATSTSNIKTSSYISEFNNAEAVNVWYNGHNIEYGVDYTTLPNLYITDVVEPNCTGSNVSYTISPCARLEQKVNGDWVEIYNSSDSIYNVHYDFNMAGLGAGYTYEYRIVAQDYTTEDPEKSTHITYFTHYIGATTRNKTLTINFKESDATTMALYNEIISNYGNLTIQVKNMNIDQLTMQQTKFYVGSQSLESNYYKISQGDYAVLVNLPEGYAARVKIVGGSTEGYLQENPYVRGKRLRLPFANSQNIRLEVTLNRVNIVGAWGVKRYKSLCKEYNRNYI